ncbi:MAG: AAA family ATPase [Chitinivibrionales bacterium]|nr:AAA family ATPase [Chitinivibrionales bacterium]
MSKIIAITGKGGVGKTTIAALVIRQLIAQRKTPVLAVDADPNTCLDTALGVTVEKSIGTVREEAREIAGKGNTAGLAKQELLQMKISESMVESQDFDFIAMGRSEGPGCYCYANNVLKQTLNEITSNYPWVVLDNEAGLENLSRRIVQHIECMIMVADASARGLDTIRRLHAITGEMGITYDKLALIVNRMRKESLSDRAQSVKAAIGAELAMGLPDNQALAETFEEAGSVFKLPDDNVVVHKIDSLMNELLT